MPFPRIDEIKLALLSLNQLLSETEQGLLAGIRGGSPKDVNALAAKEINALMRGLVAKAHSIQFNIEWGFDPQPEWFDHNLDLFYQWPALRNPLWVERGIFGLLAMRQGCNALELCCGDGFNACHFYSNRCAAILAVDFDPTAIQHARTFNQTENVRFDVCDIRTDFPTGKYDNIVWDAAIEHFTETEIDGIMRNIKDRLRPGGVLTGYTIRERTDGAKSLSHHEYEFKSKEDLARFFNPYFRNVKVFETVYPSRHNFYFYASDGVVPFDLEWGSMVQVKK